MEDGTLYSNSADLDVNGSNALAPSGNVPEQQSLSAVISLNEKPRHLLERTNPAATDCRMFSDNQQDVVAERRFINDPANLGLEVGHDPPSYLS